MYLPQPFPCNIKKKGDSTLSINNSIIDLIHVTKTFQNENESSVDDISLSIEKGECLVIIGSSGGGKTTLLRLITGFDHPTSGTILIKGENITSYNILDLRRSFFGYVFQKASLFPHMTVKENINIVLKLAKKPADFRKKRINELLEFMHLDPNVYASRYPHQLSGGEQQRVGVARALATNSECLLMDEPFGALDALTRHDLQNEILRLKESLKKTIIFVTHDLSEAFKIGDRIAVLQNGRLEQVDTKENLFKHPKTPFVQQMVSTVLGDDK